MNDQCNACNQPHQQKAGTRRTAGEGREKASQLISRSCCITPLRANGINDLGELCNAFQLTRLPTRPGSLKRAAKLTLLRKLKLNDSALHADHRGVGSVVGAQFGEDVPDLTLDSFFADRELR